MLLWASLRDGLDKVALTSSTAPFVYKLKRWRRVPRHYSFGVPPTPMTGSHNSRRTLVPTPGQRPRTSAWRPRRSRGRPSPSTAKLACWVHLDSPSQVIDENGFRARQRRTHQLRNRLSCEDHDLAAGSSAYANESTAPGPARDQMVLYRWLYLTKLTAVCGQKQQL